MQGYHTGPSPVHTTGPFRSFLSAPPPADEAAYDPTFDEVREAIAAFARAAEDACHSAMVAEAEAMYALLAADPYDGDPLLGPDFEDQAMAELEAGFPGEADYLEPDDGWFESSELAENGRGPLPGGEPCD